MSDPFIKRAMADYIQAALAGRAELDAIKLFIRGPAPMAISSDLHPYVEIFIATESPVEDLTGGVTIREYAGLISLSVQLTAQATADWLTPITDRYLAQPSYDLVEELISHIMRELQKGEHHDMGGLTVTNADGSQETVTSFELADAVTYGIEDRTNNYDNFGSVPFKVETQRRMP